MRNKEGAHIESSQTQPDEESLSTARKIGRMINRGSRHPLVKITYALGGLLFTANYVVDHVNETIVAPLSDQLRTTGSQVQSVNPKLDALNDTAKNGSSSIVTVLANTNNGLSTLNQTINPGSAESTTTPSTAVAAPPHPGGGSETASGPAPEPTEPTTTSTTATTTPPSTTIP